MGTSCCGSKNVNTTDQNLTQDFNRYVKQKRGKKKNGKDDDAFSDLDVFKLIKFQAIIRGYLTRKQVKKIYGFERTPGMLERVKVKV